MSSDALGIAYAFKVHRHGPCPDVYTEWKQFLEDGSDPNEKWTSLHDHRRRASPLFSAIMDESMQLTELLLNHGALCEERNGEGRTPLQEAVLLAREDIVRLLLNRGASVDSQILLHSSHLCGASALHLAVLEGHTDIIKILLEYGADPRSKMQVGWRPVSIAVLERQTRALRLLLGKVELATEVDCHAFDDLMVCPHVQSVEANDDDDDDDDDQAAIASHLLEHGLQDTKSRHCIYFERCMSLVIEKLNPHFTTASIEELASMLIRDTCSVLLADANLTTVNPILWPRNLCKACRRFEEQDFHDLFQIYDEHLPNFSGLVSSATAKNGCHLCQLLVKFLDHRWCLLKQIDKKWLAEFGLVPRVRLKIVKTERDPAVFGEFNLVVVCGEKIAFVDLVHIHKYLNIAIAETGPSDTTSPASDRSVAVVRAWMQRCEDEHVSCRRAELGELPTRVIDTGNGSDEPRIYVSERERVSYVALSYCWGGDQNIRLLSTNIDAYTQCLPTAIIPQTIADAIALTRRLKIRYLWVDSLCILQDSEADLRKEIAYMCDIYAGAWLTIAAKDSPSCRSGLFRQRRWPISAIVPTEIRAPPRILQQQFGINNRPKNLRTSGSNRLMALVRPHDRETEGSSGTSVLDTRGWALQEEMLSRRTLNCGAAEVSWTCLESQCTERDPEERDVRVSPKWQYALKRVVATGLAEYGNVNRLNKVLVFNLWLDVVQDFLGRGLSKPRDKLVALAGVQEATGKILEDQAVAGTWKGEFFASSLLWSVQSKGDENDSIESLQCPSWSWLSSPYLIKYVRRPTSTDNSRPWVWHHEVKFYLEAASWHVHDAILEGVYGYVTVRCKLLREADLNCEKHVVKDFLNAPPKSRSGKEAIHFETHNDFGEAATISDSWLVPVMSNQFIPGSKDRGYRYDIETHLLRLERTSSDRAEFRRIGLVTIKSWQNKWLEHAAEATICLF